MKEKILNKTDKDEKRGHKASCRTCQNCISLEDDERHGSKSNSLQLYARRPKTISFIMLSVLTNATKIYSMKPLLMVCFLTIMLLCALLLHAAGKNKKPVTKKITEQVKSVQVQKDMQFVPNAIIL